MRVVTRCDFRGLCDCVPTSLRKRRTQSREPEKSTKARRRAEVLGAGSAAWPGRVRDRSPHKAEGASMLVLVRFFRHRNHAPVGHFAVHVLELDGSVADLKVMSQAFF